MEFALQHLAGTLLRPGSLLVALALAGWLTQRWRVGRAMLACGVLGLAAIVLLPVQRWATLPLEDRFPRPSAPAHVDGVIVLGGALETFIAADRGLVSFNAAAERMTEWVALAYRYPQARLVFTGGLGTLLDGAEPEAEIARAFATAMHLAPERLTYEGRSRTTYENAVLSLDAVRPKPGEVWLLVTSATHMPRSVGVFRHLGWDVVAWPVGFKTTHALSPSWLEPLSDKLKNLDTAAHEWGGLLTYRLSGKIETLFPAP